MNSDATLDRVEVAPSWGRRLRGIEGLRGVAAITVLVGHVRGLVTPDADLGIAERLVGTMGAGLILFFALSGFLLYRPFAAGILDGSGAPSISRYAVNRVLRIYPVYIVILLAASLLLGTANVAPLTEGGGGRADRVGYLTDPGLLLLDITMLQTLLPAGVQTGLGVAWSLTVELVFYVVMPLLAIAAVGVGRRWVGSPRLRAALPAIGMICCGLACKAWALRLLSGLDGDARIVAEWGDTWTAVLVRSFLVNADLFAYGMLAAVLLETLRRGGRSRAARRWRSVALVTAALAFIIGESGSLGLYSDSAHAVSFGALIFYVTCPVGSGEPLSGRVLDWSPFRYLGLVSYSIYLWHVSVIWLLLRHDLYVSASTLWGFVVNVLITVAATVMLSTATYFLVERPALALKTRRK